MSGSSNDVDMIYKAKELCSEALEKLYEYLSRYGDTLFFGSEEIRLLDEAHKKCMRFVELCRENGCRSGFCEDVADIACGKKVARPSLRAAYEFCIAHPEQCSLHKLDEALEKVIKKL